MASIMERFNLPTDYLGTDSYRPLTNFSQRLQRTTPGFTNPITDILGDNTGSGRSLVNAGLGMPSTGMTDLNNYLNNSITERLAQQRAGKPGIMDKIAGFLNSDFMGDSFKNVNTTMDTLGSLGGAISSGFDIFGGIQDMRNNRDIIDFTKRMGTAELNNRVASYNQALERDASNQAAISGWSDQQMQDYINRHRLQGMS